MVFAILFWRYKSGLNYFLLWLSVGSFVILFFGKELFSIKLVVPTGEEATLVWQKSV